MQFMWVYIDDMVGKGLETIVILELLFFAMANLVPMALPLAVLLSSIMTFGNLGENYELVALKSSGLSLQRIMSPLIVFMVFMSLGAFYFSNNIWPKANLKFASILHDVRAKKPAFDIQDNVFYKDIDGYVIHAKHRDKKTDELQHISIYDHTDKRGNSRVIKAESGKMEMSKDGLSLVFTLKNGNLYDEMQGKTSPLYRSSFSEKQISFDLSGFKLERTDEELFKNNYKMMGLARLNAEIDTLEKEYKKRIVEFKGGMMSTNFYTKDGLNPDTTFASIEDQNNWFTEQPKEKKLQHLNWATNVIRTSKTYSDSFGNDLKHRRVNINRARIERHRKFALSIACLILFFIGAPLGAIIRKGGLGMPVVIALGFFLIFYITSLAGEKMAKAGTVSVWFGMWLSSMVLLPIGMFLTYKATTDSGLLNAEFYRNFLGKLVKIKFINSWVNRGNNQKA